MPPLLTKGLVAVKRLSKIKMGPELLTGSRPVKDVVTRLMLSVTEPLISDALFEPSVDIKAFRLNSVPEKVISKIEASAGFGENMTIAAAAAIPKNLPPTISV